MKKEIHLCQTRNLPRHGGCRRYPNSAETGYYFNRIVNGILTVATACGTVTIFIFLFAMG